MSVLWCYKYNLYIIQCCMVVNNVAYNGSSSKSFSDNFPILLLILIGIEVSCIIII